MNSLNKLRMPRRLKRKLLRSPTPLMKRQLQSLRLRKKK